MKKMLVALSLVSLLSFSSSVFAEAAVVKKSTITCVKGKLIKKVAAIKPKCPIGYKLKK
jgi:hypothetical protein